MKTKSPSSLEAAYTFVITILLCVNLLRARNVLEKDTMDFKSISLHVPSLDELQIGLGGNPAILDIGRPSGGFITRAAPDMSSSHHNLDTVASRIGVGDKRFIIGAAQGPTSYSFGKSELVVNVVLNSPASYPGSIAAVGNENNDKYSLVRLPGNETGISFVGNVLISEGKPGKVLQVHVKKRIGKILALSETMQKALAKHYPEKFVGLGGTFVSKVGKVRHHVLVSRGTGSRFIFYNMSAPLISAGILISAQTDLQLALYHFHSFSDHNDGGHYRNDVAPDEIEYLGYFTPGQVVWRVKRQNADFSGVPDAQNNWNEYF